MIFFLLTENSLTLQRFRHLNALECGTGLVVRYYETELNLLTKYYHL